MRYFVIFFSIAFVTGCMNQKENKFKDFLVGEWRIENPEHQSFIRFEGNGKSWSSLQWVSLLWIDG